MVESTINKYHLINMMIDDCDKRPPIDAVLKHLMFWQSDKSLAFLKTANTRLDKEEEDSNLIESLETDADRVTNGDWLGALDYDLKNDLVKRRKYDGSSVKELLRAIRNKVEHYNELDDSIRELTSGSPQGLVSYFTDKFPLLLLHTYLALQQCKNETAFRPYYCSSFDIQPLLKLASD